MGRDIEHIAAQLALLADPETSILFDLKYVESRLMCFDMQGIQRVQQHHQKEELRSVEGGGKAGANGDLCRHQRFYERYA